MPFTADQEPEAPGGDRSWESGRLPEGWEADLDPEVDPARESARQSRRRILRLGLTLEAMGLLLLLATHSLAELRQLPLDMACAALDPERTIYVACDPDWPPEESR